MLVLSVALFELAVVVLVDLLDVFGLHCLYQVLVCVGLVHVVVYTVELESLVLVESFVLE